MDFENSFLAERRRVKKKKKKLMAVRQTIWGAFIKQK